MEKKKVLAREKLQKNDSTTRFIDIWDEARWRRRIEHVINAFNHHL